MSVNIESFEASPDFIRLKSELVNHPEGPALYEDPNFQPKYTNIYSRNSQTEFSAEELTWNRPGQIASTPMLICENPGSMIRGHLTPEWFPTLITILQERNLLELVVPSLYFQSTFNQDPMIITPSRMAYCGAFLFNFRRGGILESVVIDDRLPCTLNCHMLGAVSSCENEFLPALLEKAYAKYVGGYYNLERQNFITALMDFTGGLVEIVTMRGEERLTCTEIESFESKITGLVGASFALCCGYQGAYVESEVRHDPFMSDTHVITGHSRIPEAPPEGGLLRGILTNGRAGSTVGSTGETGPKSSDTIPIVRVQSLGDEIFSNGLVVGSALAKGWNDIGPALRTWYRLNSSLDEAKEQWMPLEELPHFCSFVVLLHLYYRSSILALARQQNFWQYHFFQSYWHRDGPRGPLESVGVDFLLNEQYLVTVDKDDECELKVALTNIQKYVDSGANMITQDATTKTGITILGVECNRQHRVHDPAHTRVQVTHIDCDIDRCLIVSTRLTRGRYVVIPWLSVGPGTKYTLQLYSSSLKCDVVMLTTDIPEPRRCIPCNLKKTALYTRIRFNSIYQKPVTTPVINGSVRKGSSYEQSSCEACNSAYPRCATRITVLGGTNLCVSKAFQLPSFFFRLSCEDSIFTSRTIATVSDPLWNEDFLFFRNSIVDFGVVLEVFCELRYGMKSSMGQYRFKERELRQCAQLTVQLQQSASIASDVSIGLDVQHFFPSEFHKV